MKTILLAVYLVATTTGFPVNAEELKGTVNQVNGEPLSGALVAIYTAHPRLGPGVL